MELTISTINSILLPPFLFVVTFCFLCCQLPRNNRHTTATPQPPEVELVTTPHPLQEPVAAIKDILPEQEPAPVKVSTVFEFIADGKDTPVVEDNAIPKCDPIALLEASIDLNKLSIRACRAIAGQLTQLDKERLGISQKVNGEDKPTSQLVAEVKHRLKKDPTTVAPVILHNANPSARMSQTQAQAEPPQALVS
jgi:hypothetical protein